MTRSIPVSSTSSVRPAAIVPWPVTGPTIAKFAGPSSFDGDLTSHSPHRRGELLPARPGVPSRGCRAIRWLRISTVGAVADQGDGTVEPRAGPRDRPRDRPADEQCRDHQEPHRDRKRQVGIPLDQDGTAEDQDPAPHGRADDDQHQFGDVVDVEQAFDLAVEAQQVGGEDPDRAA